MESLKIRENTLGKVHPDYATSLHKMGYFYFT